MTIVKGQVIKDLREMRGMGQRELANMAGINQSVLSRLERDLQEDVMLSVIAALADTFDTSIDSLTTRTISSTRNVIPELRSLTDLLSKQPEEIQRQIAGVIRGYLSTMPSNRGAGSE